MSNDYPRAGYRDDHRGYSRDSGRGRGGGGGGGYGPRASEPRERRGVPLSELDPALTDVSRKVIGCSIEVHKTLGPGYDESVYAAALQDDLRGLGVSFKVNHAIDVRYKDRVVGKVVADLFVEDKFIVELLARPGEVTGADRQALRAQLVAADLTLGLVINFAERRLKDGLVRVLNIEKIEREKGPLGGHDDDHGPDDDHDEAARAVNFDS